MVRDQDHALREIEFDAAIGCWLDLSRDRLVSAYAHRRRPPYMCHQSHDECERLFRHGHVGVVEVSIDPVKPSAEELRRVYPDGYLVSCGFFIPTRRPSVHYETRCKVDAKSNASYDLHKTSVTLFAGWMGRLARS